MARSRPTRAIPRRALLVESLESRQMLAGNVTVELVGTTYVVTGDGQANEIFIGQEGDWRTGTGRYEFRGLNSTTITIKPIAFIPEHPPQPDGGLKINLKGGNDRLLISHDSDWNNGQPFSENWSQGGFKPLLSDHGYATPLGKIEAELGDGNDTTVITAAALGGISVAGGAGDDGVFLRTQQRREAGPNYLTGAVSVMLGNGNDYAALSLENLSGYVYLQGGAGNDTALVAFRTAVPLNMDMGAGDDTVKVEGGNIWNGFGDVRAPANGTRNQIKVAGGIGNDTLTLARLFARNLNVDAGSGLDLVEVRGANLSGNATLRGGGLVKSRVELTDHFELSQGVIDGAAAYQAVRSIESRIGGNIAINFNYDTPPPPQFVTSHPGPFFDVIVGMRYPTGVADNFTVGGNVTVLGTIADDHMIVLPIRAGTIHVDAGYGRDVIGVKGVTTSGDVTLLLGDGDDSRLHVGEAPLGTPSGIDYGLSPEAMFVPVRIGGNLIVDYGKGTQFPDDLPRAPDTVPTGVPSVSAYAPFRIGAHISGLTSNFVVAGSLQVTGSEGTNQLALQAVDAGSMNVSLGSGRSWLQMNVVLVRGDFTAAGGNDVDNWTLTRFGVGNNMTLSASGGADTVSLFPDYHQISSVGGQLTINSGGGDDEVAVGNAAEVVLAMGNPIMNLRRLQISAGDGRDRVTLGRLQSLDSLMAALGSGDDELRLVLVETLSASLDGGAGTDRLSGSLQAPGAQVTRSNFEDDTLVTLNPPQRHGRPLSVPL